MDIKYSAVVKLRSYLYDGNIHPCKSLFDFQLSIYQRKAQYISTMSKSPLSFLALFVHVKT